MRGCDMLRISACLVNVSRPNNSSVREPASFEIGGNAGERRETDKASELVDASRAG